jgi:quinol monooxygenase YgiN
LTRSANHRKIDYHSAYNVVRQRAKIWEDSMNPGCTLIAYLHAKPDKRDELLSILQSLVKPSRAESACVDYHLHVSNDDPNLFIFYENWRTRKELDEHLQTPILTKFWSQRLDLLQKDVDIKFMTMLSDFE